MIGLFIISCKKTENQNNVALKYPTTKKVDTVTKGTRKQLVAWISSPSVEEIC